MKRFECFWYQIKAEIIRIKISHQMVKTIEMMQFYNAIELTYGSGDYNVLHVLLSLIFSWYTISGTLTSISKTKKTNKKGKY